MLELVSRFLLYLYLTLVCKINILMGTLPVSRDTCLEERIMKQINLLSCFICLAKLKIDNDLAKKQEIFSLVQWSRVKMSDSRKFLKFWELSLSIQGNLAL